LRKTVTVVFCDLAGSTALGEASDPEVLETRLRRYFERMQAIVEQYGGTVEKFIGDAVVAVFGVPVAHEDDALRALRAAAEMRDAIPALGLRARIGVNTGEIFTSTHGTLVTGDAVNVAARLEQAADPGEVLVGAPTRALAGAAVEVEELQPLALKGKSDPVAAFRLLGVGEAAARSHDSLLVGRTGELAVLREAWERANLNESCELVTVVGEPGVGKSRLVDEALAPIGVRVVWARCLPYGAQITYWPVVEVIKRPGALPNDPFAAAAIHSLLGESEQGSSAEEIAWAFRKLLAEQAPLVVVFDDIQWGADTFLDLVEHVALLSAGAPLLLVCMARQELLDRRPAWPVGVRLQPLDDDAVGALIGDRVPVGLRDRIAKAAAGNPLFVTEMLAIAGERGDEVEVPPTLRALLAARLDQLDPSERRIIERGSVEGEVFHRGAVQTLTPEEPNVTPRLAGLVRRELIRPHPAQLSGEDGFRFRHLLIRDAAYEALPKATRADLHERFAAWLEQHGGELVELDEILGYHLEQAASYLEELGQPSSALALAAGERLGAAGRRAYWRGDSRSATGLLERALALTRPHRLDLRLEVALAEALYWSDIPRAIDVADTAAERATAADDPAGAALARTVAAMMRFSAGQGSLEDLERVSREALPLVEAARDDDGAAIVWDALGEVANVRSRYEDWAEALEKASRHAHRAGHGMVGALFPGVALTMGPRPASEALARLDAFILEQGRPVAHPGDLLLRGLLLSMLDRFEEAWAVAVPANDHARELGFPTWGGWLGEIALLEGDHEAAATHLREACEALEASGNTGNLSTAAPKLGRALCALGRYDEAELLAQQGRDLGDPEDISTQQTWRQAQALVHSARGHHAEAELLAREAVDLSLRSDSLFYRGNAYSDLAEVLEAAGRRDEASAAFREAIECYERKEVIPLARRTRDRLASLQTRQA
jgi:class 3 adenylate cyclase/tetratricopeptide (TPR) repeat protein